MNKTALALLREIYDDVVQGALPNPDDEWFENTRAALAAAPAQQEDWTAPTTVLRRMGDALQLLCAGQRPDDAMLSSWLDQGSEELQSFCAQHGPIWCQGIAVIDAAMQMVDQPTEIVTPDSDADHEHRAAPAQPVAQWVSVAERLPKPGNPVLLDIGTKTPIRAMWAAKHTIEAGDECPEDWAEYVEEDDMYYSPEGWYEWNQHEETHWSVTDVPVAWMDLPAPYSADASPAQLAAPAQAAPVDAESAGRTDAEIVEQTETLARYLLSWKWGLEPDSPKTKLRNSQNHKAQKAWNAACEIQDLLTATDVENAVAEVDDATRAAQKWKP